MLFVTQKAPKAEIPSVSSQIFVGAQPATVPSKPASAGMTAPGYATLLTNDPVAQLGALVACVDTAVTVKMGP